MRNLTNKFINDPFTPEFQKTLWSVLTVCTVRHQPLLSPPACGEPCLSQHTQKQKLAVYPLLCFAEVCVNMFSWKPGSTTQSYKGCNPARLSVLAGRPLLSHRNLVSQVESRWWRFMQKRPCINKTMGIPQYIAGMVATWAKYTALAKAFTDTAEIKIGPPH